MTSADSKARVAVGRKVFAARDRERIGERRAERAGRPSPP